LCGGYTPYIPRGEAAWPCNGRFRVSPQVSPVLLCCSSATVVIALLAFVSGLALIIGFMTPIASALLSAGGLLLTVDSNVTGYLLLFESGMARLEFIVMSVALIPLGPGALSLDARLYGRREVNVNGNGL
jgi:uncharacterized membrane protein YphA (DoxX/SURF4 family)